MPRENMTQWDDKLYQKVDRYNLVPNLEECLQCGKCTGNCPVAAMHPSYNPRQIVHDILQGESERVLQSEEIWRCLWCANCYRVCPVDIHYPLLMMQLRYLALENGYGLKYVTPINKYAYRAMEKGLTFVPGQKGIEKIMGLREGIGVEAWPKVSEKAINEYSEIFKQTGAYDWMKALDKVQGQGDEKQVTLTFLGGRLIDERYDAEEGN